MVLLYNIIIITRGSHFIKCVEPFATRIKIKSIDQKVNLAKSSDQWVVQTGNKHISGFILRNQH